MATALSWRANNSSAAVAVAAHRAAVAGHAVVEAGHDFHFTDGAPAPLLAALGLGGEPDAGPGEGRAVRPPRIALFAGPAAGYPYYAYYAHCLLSLGLTYRAVDGQDIAAGALDEVDLFVIPGGFATWGFDRAEAAPGADAAVRRLLERGGAALGSCGGAFYLSDGRSGWSGSIAAKPKYTHEYLLTGAAVVNLAIEDARLGEGLPPTVEVPYYHGPVYEDAGSNAQSLASFRSLTLPSRLFIDNPLAASTFEQDMANRPAALFAAGSGGRAIAFSPHPEMGDFVRKFIAIDGYVRKYLPIRGAKVLDETLRFYVPEDAPAFRLVLNAIRLLGPFAGRSAFLDADGPQRRRLALRLSALDEVLASRRAAVSERLSAQEDAAFAALLNADLERQEEAWRAAVAELAPTLDEPTPRLDRSLCLSLERLLVEAEAGLAELEQKPIAHALAMVELPLRLLVAALRIVRSDIALARPS